MICGRVLVIYVCSAIVVAAGVSFGVTFLERQPHRFQDGPGTSAYASWDGVWYTRIVLSGYTYDPDAKSTVAFFPAYPLMASGVSQLTGVSAETGLLIVSHVCLMAAFVVLAAYLDQRYEGETTERNSLILLAMAFWPTTVFFRMAYSESLFLLVLVLCMYGMERRWHIVAIAAMIGGLTGTRTVGVAMLPVFVFWLWQISNGNWRRFVAQAVVYLPVACWGLAAYMLYQYSEFGDALAFAKTQSHWVTRSAKPFSDHVVSLLSWEPMWSVYLPAPPTNWMYRDPVRNPVFSLQFANPIYVVVTAVLVFVGARKKWLNVREVLLSTFLLLIPYVAHSYQAVMYSQARYASVVFPAYMVLGQLAYRVPAHVRGPLFGLAGFMLGCYAALFAAWYRIF